MITPTAIRDRSIMDVDTLKTHMRIHSSNETYDTLLSLYIDACKEQADFYCNNPFLASDGTEAAIPSGVEVWIMQQAAALFANPEGNVSKIKMDESQETQYIINDYDLNFKLLKPYRLEAGFGLI